MLRCVGDSNPLPAELPSGGSVGRALMPREQRVVGWNPTQSGSRGFLGVAKLSTIALTMTLEPRVKKTPNKGHFSL